MVIISGVPIFRIFTVMTENRFDPLSMDKNIGLSADSSKKTTLAASHLMDWSSVA